MPLLSPSDAAPLAQTPIAAPGFALRCLIRQMHQQLAAANRALNLQLWDGGIRRLGVGAPTCTLRIADPRLPMQLLVGRRSLTLARAYREGRIEILGDLCDALALRRVLDGRPRPVSMARPSGVLGRLARAWQGGRVHHRDGDAKAIRTHYDLSNDFFALWLDSQRLYSCAYFIDPGDSLEQAQRQKMDLICRKLRLRPGERLLDIGCGWGALLLHAVRHYGVRGHGITLSPAQHAFVRARIAEEGLGERVEVELRDYRDLPADARYDKIASIGMVEHVGLRNVPLYLAAVHRALKPGGLFLNHGITHDEEGWHRSTEARFINTYVFPEGELDCISSLQLAMERTGFEIQDVEALRRHYALTLRHWLGRLEARSAEAQALVGAATYRTWRLYLAGCALVFEEGGTGIYQVLLSRRGAEPALPMTRHDLYASA